MSLFSLRRVCVLFCLLFAVPLSAGDSVRAGLEGLDWAGNYRFGDELAALTSAEVRREVERLGIELIGWRALAG